MRAVIMGSGAIGGLTAAFTTKGGADVTLVCHHRGTAKKIREEGLRITGLRGNICHRMRAVSDVSQLSGQYDQIIIATKAYDMEAAARSVLPYLKPDGLMTGLQNGMCLDRLEEIAGPERAAAGVVSWSCTMVGDAQLQFTGEGTFTIGRRSGERDARIGEARNLLRYAAPVFLSDDICADIYSKLIINSGITCGGALTGQKLGPMLKSAAVRRFFTEIVREDMALADALGLRVPPFGGRLDYEKFLRGTGPVADMRRSALLRAVGARYRNLTSSSLTSLRRGRPTEVDFLNGWISEKAAEYGVPAPVNDAVVRMIREIERGVRESTPENIPQLLAETVGAR